MKLWYGGYSVRVNNTNMARTRNYDIMSHNFEVVKIYSKGKLWTEICH